MWSHRISTRRSTRGLLSAAIALAAAAVGAILTRVLDPHAGHAGPEPDDATLAHKVETELFRDRTIPKGRMNINAEHGTVILRGVADSQDQIERMMLVTLAIRGVRGVQSLLRVEERTSAPRAGEPSELPGGEPMSTPYDEPPMMPFDEPAEPILAGHGPVGRRCR